MKGMIEKFPELLGLSLDKQIQANLKVSLLICVRLLHSDWEILPPWGWLPPLRQAGLPVAYMCPECCEGPPSGDLVKYAKD